MPRAPRVCATPGCTAPAHNGNRCETHRLAKRKADDARRPTARQRGYDAEWERTRAAYLAAHPTCVDCGRPARHVDHIDGAGPLAPNGHDWAALQSMCASCHAIKTARHDGSFGRTTQSGDEHH